MRGPRWTEPELETIRQWFAAGRGRGWPDKRIIVQLAETLPDRSAKAIQQQAWRMGVPRRDASQPVPRLSRAGQDSKPRAASAAPPRRRCLTCRKDFQPGDRFDFVCDPCEGTPTWRCGMAYA